MTEGDEKERNGREDNWIDGKRSGGDISEGVGERRRQLKRWE